LFSFAFLGARRLERLRIAIVSSLNAGGLLVQRLAFWIDLRGLKPHESLTSSARLKPCP
jgi:hypothetical protein